MLFIEGGSNDYNTPNEMDPLVQAMCESSDVVITQLSQVNFFRSQSDSTRFQMHQLYLLEMERREPKMKLLPILGTNFSKIQVNQTGCFDFQ